ncbi:hypothetical protein CYMTET_45301 [Cymbomonas tetramitiformis]|uniref:Uncharacterized protein n=1 Tax=Cymbomonas tetramitiformis TaxID=36881 RepID=A0AAE0BYI4_9CHLO|nr:hypothetical protein CYMTET_45301 [Cymbomonas tetramitiformis]
MFRHRSAGGSEGACSREKYFALYSLQWFTLACQGNQVSGAADQVDVMCMLKRVIDILQNLQLRVVTRESLISLPQ